MDPVHFQPCHIDAIKGPEDLNDEGSLNFVKVITFHTETLDLVIQTQVQQAQAGAVSRSLTRFLDSERHRELARPLIFGLNFVYALKWRDRWYRATIVEIVGHNNFTCYFFGKFDHFFFFFLNLACYHCLYHVVKALTFG